MVAVVLSHSLFVWGGEGFCANKTPRNKFQTFAISPFCANFIEKVVSCDSCLATPRHTRCFDKHGVQNIITLEASKSTKGHAVLPKHVCPNLLLHVLRNLCGISNAGRLTSPVWKILSHWKNQFNKGKCSLAQKCFSELGMTCPARAEI